MAFGDYLFVMLVSGIAFYIKGVTGTGTTTVIVALGTLVIDPKVTIVLAAFINIFGGLNMVRVDPVPMRPRYWAVIAFFMVLGSVAGAYALKYTPNRPFHVVLGLVLLLTAVLFFVQKKKSGGLGAAPSSASGKDMAVGALSGVFSGYVGISAPPLVYYFGGYLDKRYLRRLLVLVYIPAVTVQTLVFMANGLFTREVFLAGVLMLPLMFVGIHLGNRTFNRISEKLFRRLLGAVMIVASARLLLIGFLGNG